jgi:hypothetical protein
MSISQNFPEEGPTLNLNFAGSRTLDPRITFTRTSSATYMGRDGLVKIAPANSARFDHRYNSTTGEIESLGLLVEEQRTNLITYSEDFNDASWGKNDVTVDSNLTISPSGELTADKIVENTANNIHYISKSSIGITQGNSQTFSFYVKAAERTIIRFENIQGAGRRVFVDLLTGTITNATSIGTGGLDSFSESVINVGNGWWRIISTIDPTVGASSSGMTIMLVISGTNITYTGDGSSGVYMWGAQVEQGSFPTSYIPTTTSTVTRTPDNVSMVGENFSSWYNQSEGTLFFIGSNQYVSTTNGNAKGFVVINDSSANTRIDFRQRIIYSILSSNGTNVSWSGISTPTDITDITDSSFQKVGMTYSSNSHAQAQNGYLTRTSTTPIEPINATRLAFFVRDGQTSPVGEVGGHIAQLTYYPNRLSNSQLITLTK